MFECCLLKSIKWGNNSGFFKYFFFICNGKPLKDRNRDTLTRHNFKKIQNFFTISKLIQNLNVDERKSIKW